MSDDVREELQGFVEAWRDDAASALSEPHNRAGGYVALTYQECAEEIEAFLKRQAAHPPDDAEAVTEHPCQVCGKKYPPTLLLDLKGNVPGGCKVTCLECAGRLEERERCAKLAAEFDHHNYGTCERIAAAIRVGNPANL